MNVKQQLSRLVQSGYQPDDSEETRLKKAALTLVPLIIGPAAFIWGTIYILLGKPYSGFIPMSYSIISALTLAYYFKTGRTTFLEKSQLVLVLLLPFFLMWSLGGFFHGSTVMIWALFAPIAATMFMSRQHAIYWFLAYMLLLLISAGMQHFLETTINPLPEIAIVIFFVLNLGAGSAGLYLLTSFTINQEKEAFQRAYEANNAKSEFLANMSHELRTPLHGILSYAEFGQQKFGSELNPKARKYFSQISASGSRLKVLLDDLLDLSKLEAGKMMMEFTRVNLKELFQECLDEQEAAFRMHNVTVVNELSDIELECDRNRLGQIIMNLLSNAIKFSPAGGTVTLASTDMAIRTSRGHTEAGITISIIDQGPGIPAGEEETIFQKFVQSSQNQTKASSGTGLGLAITRELIRAHNGNVWCRNQPQGGALFCIELPLKHTPVSPD